VSLSTEEFDKYSVDIKEVAEAFRNKSVQAILDKEFAQLKRDRDYYRRVHKQMEDHNPREYVYSTSKQMPVNIPRILDDTLYNYREIIDGTPKEKRTLDPARTVERVDTLCKELAYAFRNETCKKNASPLPKYIRTATNLMQVLIRSYLNVRTLLKKGFIDALLDICITRITLVYKKALIEAGTSVGIIAAQCISEPMTQYVLDSKHRTGGQGGTKTNAIVRIQEILGAKPTESMKNPHMTVLVDNTIEHDKIRVQEIANYIEMMHLGRFISDEAIFFESYGKPVHPAYTHEAADIKAFERASYGSKIPTDLAHWCIRLGLNREELILKSMKLETVVMAIRRAHPGLFVMYTPENVDNVYLRVYFRVSAIKQSSDFYENVLVATLKALRDTIIRGVKDILAANVIDVICNREQPDGSITQTKVYAIQTTGSNLTDVLSNEHVDAYRTQSDSIQEIERVFGVNAARHKIINEMNIALDGLNRIHCSLFADEMCYSGMVTNIQKTGLQRRENANITLRVSFQTAIQVIQDAAVNGLVDKIGGISGPLVMGTTPNMGTTYNKVVVNRDFVEEQAASVDAALEDL